VFGFYGEGDEHLFPFSEGILQTAKPTALLFNTNTESKYFDRLVN
jgi:hypothetical protein